jgi:hypothetical protein
MTKVIISMGEDGGAFFFDCENHSGDHDVCTITSTLCNVVVARCQEKGYKIDEYREGHVRIAGNRCDEQTNAVLRSVLRVFEQVQEQNPGALKVY